MSDIIYCRLSVGNEIEVPKPWKQGEEVEFMYMPAGVHTITAGFRGKAITMTVAIEPAQTAGVLQACFDGLVSEAPKQKPFGCIEHKEEDASIWAKRFVAKEDGVYLAAEPSALGERNVNGRIHRSWSPSFTTDADYAHATAKDGEYQFPDGVRGSAQNPARITGVAFCVGTLTNKPAFKAINPVMAKDTTTSADKDTNKDKDTSADKDTNKDKSTGVNKVTGEDANDLSTTPPEPAPPQAETGDLAPTCLRTGSLLALLSNVRVAHWNASTTTNEHRALGELYEALDSTVDTFVELYMGKRKIAACGDAPSTPVPEMLEGGCSAVSELRKALTVGEDDDLLNALADIEAALSKAKYMLKEPQESVESVLAHLTPIMTLDSVWARISPLKRQTGKPAA